MTNTDLRQEVCRVNRQLLSSGLVTMHSGNASGYDPSLRQIYIKPSGVDYETLTPEMLVVVDLESGQVIGDGLKPSVDLPHHLALYRNDPAIRGIVHTHSNFATAFAACHQPIPLCLTAIADEFGGEIPCTRFAECDEFDLTQAIFEAKTAAPAILIANHGMFSWGDSPSSALKAAIMTEDVAKTVHLAMQMGDPKPIASASAEAYHDRYQNRYGQIPVEQDTMGRRPR